MCCGSKRMQVKSTMTSAASTATAPSKNPRVSLAPPSPARRPLMGAFPTAVRRAMMQASQPGSADAAGNAPKQG